MQFQNSTSSFNFTIRYSILAILLLFRPFTHYFRPFTNQSCGHTQALPFFVSPSGMNYLRWQKSNPMKRWLTSLFRSQAASTEPTAAPMDAVILNAHVTGVRKESLEEVMLLLQVMPEEGRQFIIQHTEFVHPHYIHQLLQVGHRVRVTNTSYHPLRVQLMIG